MEYRISEIENKNIWGRCAYSGDKLVLFWTESGVEFNVKAGSLFAVIEVAYNLFELWLDVFVDDERIMRFPLKNGKERYQILRGFDKNKETRVRIARNTQSMPEDSVSLIKICSIETDGEFLPVPKRDYNLEFIGDSITSGEGSAAITREEWIPTVFDPAIGYVAKTAAILNAQYSVYSQSGWGLFASWDGNTDCAIPLGYSKICGSQKTEPAIKSGAGNEWDFDVHRKDAVIINLGTNDSSAMRLDKWSKDEFSTLFKQCGIAFLKDVRCKNPDAKIVWAYGMLGKEMEEQIIEMITEYNSINDDKVYYFSMPDCSGKHVSARLHPDPEGHGIAANVLAEFIKEVL